jgi:hypothetical protein
MGIDVEVIGEGSSGDKARQLIAKTAKLREIGFYTPRRVVFAEGYLNPFFQRNSLGRNLREINQSDKLEDRIRSGTLTSEQFQILQRVCHSFGSAPLAVRSSAEGDSRGTGTYDTQFSINSSSKVRKAMQRVLASYFTKDALVFRRDAKTGEGFGIMLEPIAGQMFEDGLFAPIFSGFGYTSTSRGGAYVKVVPGLGGGVESKKAERLTKDVLAEFDDNLHNYIDSVTRGYDSGRPSIFTKFEGKAMFVDAKYQRCLGRIMNTRLNPIREVYHQFMDLRLNDLFEKIEKMEEAFKQPQYFEFATTLHEGKPRYWITQIADVDKKLDFFDFANLGKVVLEGKNVIGSDIRECNGIADCWNPSDIPNLYKFNQANTDYILVFSSRCSSSINRESRLHYSDFSNASVLLEIEDARHVDGDIVSHLGGQANVAGKLAATLNFEGETIPQLNYLRAKQQVQNGLSVYPGRYKVTASERQNRLVVGEINN